MTFSFDCITTNSATDCGIGEAQLAVDVTAGPAANEVSFAFTNTGLAASSITDVYFDDGSLLALARLVDFDDNGGDPLVDFSPGASPPNLPGGESIGFVATAGFTADSDAPTQPNGVNPGEELIVIFTLSGGGTLADVLSELDSGELRIGIHVQGFDLGGSEGLVNIPEPAAASFLGLGLLALGLLRRAS